MDDLARALAAIDGVMAVGLGGSRGLGIADEGSDYDFVLFRDGGEAIGARRIVDAIRPLLGRAELQISGNFVQTQMRGRKIEIFQNDLAAIAREIAMAQAGKFRWTVHPLLPHGDLSTRSISHLISAEICHEKESAIRILREKALPFPFPLKNSLIRYFIKHSSYLMTHAGKVRRPEDLQNLIALISGFVYSVNIVIFSLNDMYPVLEKGAARVIPSLSYCPKDYGSVVRSLFQAGLEGDLGEIRRRMGGLMGELEGRARVALENNKKASPGNV